MTELGLTDVSIDTAQGWPDGSKGPFFAVIDRGGVSEEKVLLQSRSGTVLKVLQRGADDTTPYAHNTGASIEHVFTALEADEANAHVNSGDGVHGVPSGQTIATQTFVANAVADAHPQTYSEEEAPVTGTTGPTGRTTVHALPYPEAADPLLTRKALEDLAKRLDIRVTLILSGTGDPPSPTGLPDGALYLRRRT